MMSTVQESFLVGLIGSGITDSLTPPMHELAADALGLRYLYRPLDIDALGPKNTVLSAEDCGTLLHYGLALGFNAFNITFPCKQLILRHLDELSEHAARLGAVNTVVVKDGRTFGYNTDFSGFRRALSAELTLSEKDLLSVTQLGAGGAGSATAYALLARGVRELNLYDVTFAQAQARTEELEALFPGRTVRALSAEELPAALAASGGLVNATPVGMHHHPGAPLDLSLLRSEMWVADVIYLPQDTPLITAARDLGARTLTGGAMAVGQAVDAFELITGITPDAELMRAYFLERTGS